MLKRREGFLPAMTNGTLILVNTLSNSQHAAFSFSATDKFPWYKQKLPTPCSLLTSDQQTNTGRYSTFEVDQLIICDVDVPDVDDANSRCKYAGIKVAVLMPSLFGKDEGKAMYHLPTKDHVKGKKMGRTPKMLELEAKTVKGSKKGFKKYARTTKGSKKK